MSSIVTYGSCCRSEKEELLLLSTEKCLENICLRERDERLLLLLRKRREPTQLLLSPSVEGRERKDFSVVVVDIRDRYFCCSCPVTRAMGIRELGQYIRSVVVVVGVVVAVVEPLCQEEMQLFLLSVVPLLDDTDSFVYLGVLLLLRDIAVLDMRGVLLLLIDLFDDNNNNNNKNNNNNNSPRRRVMLGEALLLLIRRHSDWVRVSGNQLMVVVVIIIIYLLLLLLLLSAPIGFDVSSDRK